MDIRVIGAALCIAVLTANCGGGSDGQDVVVTDVSVCTRLSVGWNVCVHASNDKIVNEQTGAVSLDAYPLVGEPVEIWLGNPRDGDNQHLALSIPYDQVVEGETLRVTTVDNLAGDLEQELIGRLASGEIPAVFELAPNP